MPPGNRKPVNASDLLLSELISEGMQRAKLEMDIVEFATDILEIELWPSQRAILKALYQLPLERGTWGSLFKGRPEEVQGKLAKYGKKATDYWDEREILQNWAIEGKTTWVEGQHYQELSLEAGMRSSKTAIISVVCAYEYFKLIQHPDPAKEFGLMAGSPIHLLVLATTEVQSKDTLFANIKGRLEQAPYFQGLRQQGKLIINTLDIQYPSKNITIWAGHSNSSGLVGRTLMIFAMDEANRFGIEGGSGQSGVDLYANVGKGTLTLSRFGSKKIVISSAWCEGDLTDRLFINAEGEASHILAFRLATWDMNPEFALLKEEHPSIKAEYLTRGVEAMRDYAGVRPGSEENFFHKHALARASKYPLQVDYIPKISVQQGPDGPRKFSSIEVIAPQEVVKGAMFSFGHCDPGLKHDSFGFLSAHPVVDPLTGNVIVQVNAVLEWRPVDKGRGDIYLVDYENVCDEIIKLSKSIHLKKLTFDHWNSAMMIQRIYSAGISTELWKSSFSQTEQRKIYQVLREWIDQDRVRIPPPDQSPAAAKLHKELSEIKLMNGRRIDHPKPKGSKDLSDCLACVVYRISQDERRFRYFETGSNNIRTSGQIHTARAINDLFAEERQLADRAKLVDPRRSSNTDTGSMRNTRITQKDW